MSRETLVEKQLIGERLVPAGTGTAFSLDGGQILRIVDVEG